MKILLNDLLQTDLDYYLSKYGEKIKDSEIISKTNYKQYFEENIMPN